jgi:hypothetical protein
MKRATRRAEVYAHSEIEAILTAPRQPRDRVLLTQNPKLSRGRKASFCSKGL